MACALRSILATVLSLALSAGAARAAEHKGLSVVLTGQSLVQSDFRVQTPGATAAIRPLLQGDVVFTNFETTVKLSADTLDQVDPVYGAVYGPPEALEALKALGFNLLALSNNHSMDIGPKGVANTLAEAKARHLAHAGIGANIDEARAPGYLQAGRARIALVSMASGLIRAGGQATPTRPGVNEIRMVGGVRDVDAGRPEEADAGPILQSIAEAARQADLVIRLPAQPCLR